MKIILLQDVKSLGKKGDICDVSDGHAKNLLLPKKLAIQASNENLNNLNNKKEAEKVKKEKEKEAAQRLAEKINQAIVIIKATSGENGKLFGSITSKDICDKLKDANIDIDKKKLDLTHPLKSLGITKIDVKVYPGIIAKLTVKIEQE